MLLLVLTRTVGGVTVYGNYPLDLENGGSSVEGTADDMTANGTIVYAPGPICNDGHMSGPLDGTNYWSNPDLYTKMAATANSYSIEFDIFWTTETGYPVAWSIDDDWFFSYYSDGSQRLGWNTNGNFDLTTVGTYEKQQCYKIRMEWDGTNKKMWVDGVLAINTLNSGTWSGTRFEIGPSVPGGTTAKCYLENMVFTDSAPATPTQTHTPTITKTPIPMNKFTPSVSNPILEATLTWEISGGNARISTVNDGNKIRAAYWGGPYSADGAAIGMATSTDGINFTRLSNDPVIGNGFGGDANSAWRPTLIKRGDSDYVIYYHDVDHNVHYATSTDGDTWTAKGWFLPETVSAKTGGTFLGWCCIGAYKQDDHWVITAQAIYPDAKDYEDHLFYSFDGLGPQDGSDYSVWVKNLDELAMNASDLGTGRGMFYPYTGTINNMTQNFYASTTSTTDSFPWNIYHALPDTNKYNYNKDTNAVLLLDDMVAVGGPWQAAPDVLADTSVVEFNGKTFLYVSVADNTNFVHKLGVAIFPGSVNQLFGGGINRGFDFERDFRMTLNNLGLKEAIHGAH